MVVSSSLSILPSACSFPSTSSIDSSSSIEDGSTEKFFHNNSIADFVRFERGSHRTSGELQTAVVSYRKRFLWPILRVDLVSTIHIADKDYFTTLQKELEPYDCVLYQMVASRYSLENRRNPATTRMARILMLDFHLDYLDYRAENCYHADLDYETFKLLQLEKGESFFSFAGDMTIRSTKAIVQPTIPEELGPWRSKLLWASCELPMPLTSEYPEIEALSRLDFGAAMKVFLAKRLTSEHMPDLGNLLQEEFDLVPSQVQWITSWSKNRDLKSTSFPFLTRMAGVLDFWFWLLFFGTTVNWFSQIAHEVNHMSLTHR
ncbi:hypothetical protein P3X46_019409 [Hevea brasiliensis]|uniref:Uncharacterized protein n=1 Tax=Hevea brasiliensis TaxID=3981 RepID=A0ABQ9LIM0_HEVBR|nr:hypothetical protein P3X46_019409 [Hevea brasiliensis]